MIGRTSFISGKLLCSIVERGHGEKLVEITKSAGARGGTLVMARGTAASRFLLLLGLGDSEKDFVLTITSHSELAPIVHALRSDPWIAKKVRGIAFVLDVNAIVKHVMSSDESSVNTEPHTEEAVVNTSDYELISVIVNAGYADDVMDAARNAGATGGTIINARGTGREEDVKFFGITIVPEKELMLILATKDSAPAILEAIRSTPCLSEPGIGIAYCMDVDQFIPLGKK